MEKLVGYAWVKMIEHKKELSSCFLPEVQLRGNEVTKEGGKVLRNIRGRAPTSSTVDNRRGGTCQ